MTRVFLPAKSSAFASCSRFTPIMYLITVGVWAVTALLGRGNARGAEFVRGAHRETELRKKLKPTQPANSSVRPWKGGVPIYKVQFGGGAN